MPTPATQHSRNRINIGGEHLAAPYANYSDAVSRWFNEVNNQDVLATMPTNTAVDTTFKWAVVWAQTNLIGCGYARCKDVLGVLGMGMRAVLVCHYNPQGNKIPAFKWASNNSKKCSECPPDAPACHEGLCYMPLNNKTTIVTIRRSETRSGINIYILLKN
uniref:SCP domain-containing protein n=1 Tax=Ditylenchus dipsaci TaxID=166011 RepID=A0A915CSS9_9BILA